MISNFITPPDLIETVLILDATEAQIQACADRVRTAAVPYNVYIYNADMNSPEWLERVQQITDTVLDAKIKDPLEYFDK